MEAPSPCWELARSLREPRQVWRREAHQGSQTQGSHARFGESGVTSGWRLGLHPCKMSPHACPALTLFPLHPLWPLLKTEFGVREIFASCV